MNLGRIFDPVLTFTGHGPAVFPEPNLVAQMEDVLRAESGLVNAMRGNNLSTDTVLRISGLLIRSRQTREQVYQTEAWRQSFPQM